MTSAISLTERCDFRNVLARVWRPHLSTDEFAFLHYVIDNSVEWGREALDVTIDQMVNGVPNPPDHAWPWKLPPIGIARRTLERVIQKLRTRGAILVEAIRNRCTIIRLNTFWAPLEGMMSFIAPKRLRERLEQQTNLFGEEEITATVADIDRGAQGITANQAVNNRHGGGPIKQDTKQNTNDLPTSLRSPQHSLLPTPVNIRKRERPPEKKEALSLSPAARPARSEESVKEAVERVRRMSVENRQQQAAKAKQADSPSSYHRTYVNAWAEAYEGVPCPTWSEKDMHMVRSVLKSRLHDTIQSRHDFLEFIVKNWAQIISAKFGWMTKEPPPSKPSIKFVTSAKLIGNFLDAFADRRHFDTIRLLPAEQQEVERLIISGKSRDEAIAAVGERRALSKIKAKDSEVKAMNGDMIRRAEAERAKLVAERKQLLRERAAAQVESKPEPETFEEIGDLAVELIELPPMDYSKWN